ncbi:hypothetical protein Tco_1533381 [Tanacetum coccineum]
MSRKFALLEEEMPIIETMAYHDKYKKILDEAVNDFPIRLEGQVNENALAYTGSDINTMHYWIYEQLGREDMKKVDRGITIDSHHSGKEAMDLNMFFLLRHLSVLLGDFNEVCEAGERFGSIFNEKQAKFFNEFIVNNSLIDIRLGEPNMDYGPTPFCFFHSWLEMEDFHDLVTDTWNNDDIVEVNGLILFKKKLQNLKQVIREWAALKKSATYKLKKYLPKSQLYSIRYQCGLRFYLVIGPSKLAPNRVLPISARLRKLAYFKVQLFGHGDNNQIIARTLRWLMMLSSFGEINVLGVCVSDEEVSDMANVIGCGVTKLPFKYLGVPVGCNMARTLHKREYDRRVNERQMQTTEEEVDASKALDASLVDTESSEIEINRETNTRSANPVNDSHANDAESNPNDRNSQCF